MASLLEEPAAPSSGNQEISALADAWAVMAVQAVLDPDDGEVLINLPQLLHRLAQCRLS
jgi:hypothetical protein